ncbi:hypothetical protein Afil01_03370 [Actinorhabdospora filicis]|uniref:Uncharacterized protein n=1 Tax=Actinorhabdospora filicis TaxID=1785913 RepID=A0A9W6W8C7_9ACTN|nr:hypothetical protein [Actinorhabdospora filicis]GLZ75530.1 hypothetical protein Afil01_03370 [Actinorhabdospora filicis]
MRRLGTVADRLLNRLVPASKAAAAPGKCTPMWGSKECPGGEIVSCYTDASCNTTCGVCPA